MFHREIVGGFGFEAVEVLWAEEERSSSAVVVQSWNGESGVGELQRGCEM